MVKSNRTGYNGIHKSEDVVMTDNKKRKMYLPAKEFFDVVIDALRKETMTPEITEAIMMLAEKQANHSNWVRYSHLREEIISESILICVEKWSKFKPYRNHYAELVGHEWDGEEVEYHHERNYNPHAYFTTIIINHLKNWIKEEYNETNIVNQLRLDNGLEASQGYLDAMKKKEDRLALEEAELEQPEEEEVIDKTGIVWQTP